MGITVFFFRGRGLVPWLVRFWQWVWANPCPAFADVPAHVGIRVGDVYFEAIWTGVCHGTSIEPTWFFPVPGCDGVKAKAFLNRCVGLRYDRAALACDAVGHLYPTIRMVDDNARAYDCSRLVATALAAGGVTFPAERLPITPLDVLNFLRALRGPTRRPIEDFTAANADRLKSGADAASRLAART